MSVSVRVTRNQFPQMAAALPVRRRVIIGRRGAQMVHIAQQRSRVDTGRMRAGWRFRETNTGGVLENDVPYTIYNEYGTYKMSAQPMARPAADEVFPLIVDDLRRAVEELAR